MVRPHEANRARLTQCRVMNHPSGTAALLLPVLTTLASAQTPANWTRQIPQNFPPARISHAMAFDTTHGQVVLFGGYVPVAPLTIFNDTWLWDGSNWTEASPATSPSGRAGVAMAYDSAHQQVVMFGGSNNTGFNDTWVWDGSNWTEKSPQTSPPSRYYHAMAYDSAHGQVVLFGGLSGGVALGDTWVWDGANWTQKTSQTSPPARSGHALAYDSAHGQVVLFGGSNGANDTWVWDGTNWTLKSPTTSPEARGQGAMAYDSAHGQVVLFGGTELASPYSVLQDTWVWDGTNWTEESPQTSPTARGNHGMAYDSNNDLVVLFGGGDSGAEVYGDTWTWNGGPPPAPVISAIVNGASFAGGGVVPGGIATLFGTNLTSAAGINLSSGLPLPTIFLKDSLTTGNESVALFAVDNVNGQQQINFQVPWEVASGPNASFTVNNNGTPSASFSAAVLAAQPGIFNYSVGNDTFGAILHANFQLADTGHPAKPGEIVLIYCTGLGAVASPPADGAAGNGQPTKTTPTVMIGGTHAVVSFSGLAPGFVGLYQINVEVPAGTAAGNQAVVVTMAGASSNSVLLPVQ